MVDSAKTATEGDDRKRPPKPHPVRRFLRLLGPGITTGASDDDPSGIGTYATTGATYGYALLWMAPLTLPLMIGVQLTCARVGLVSGMGLGAVLKRHYSRWLLFPTVFILVVANTVNAGADIGAISAAINLLVPIPITAMIIPIAILIVALQILGTYRQIATVFKWSSLVLLAYVGSGILANPPVREVLRSTFTPIIHLDRGFVTTMVAILGTTISPYLFFWQTSQEVEEETHHGRTELSQRIGATHSELIDAEVDTDLGMFLAIIVMYFIMLATAATLHASGQTHIETAADAAKALRPLAGNASSLLLAIGLIGTGFLAVPILTTTSAYAVAEAFDWKEGLDERPWTAPQFFTVIIASTAVGLAINFVGISPISALYWTAVLNGILAPPLLVVITLAANNRKVMGEQTNGRLSNIACWSAAAVMSAAALALIFI